MVLPNAKYTSSSKDVHKHNKCMSVEQMLVRREDRCLEARSSALPLPER